VSRLQVARRLRLQALANHSHDTVESDRLECGRVAYRHPRVMRRMQAQAKAASEQPCNHHNSSLQAIITVRRTLRLTEGFYISQL
jgi:hypothetical protein